MLLGGVVASEAGVDSTPYIFFALVIHSFDMVVSAVGIIVVCCSNLAGRCAGGFSGCAGSSRQQRQSAHCLEAWLLCYVCARARWFCGHHASYALCAARTDGSRPVLLLMACSSLWMMVCVGMDALRCVWRDWHHNGKPARALHAVLHRLQLGSGEKYCVGKYDRPRNECYPGICDETNRKPSSLSYFSFRESRLGWRVQVHPCL